MTAASLPKPGAKTPSRQFITALFFPDDTFQITTGGLAPKPPGIITRAGAQAGAFRRPAVASRNILVAFRRSYPTN
ncbi:MAG: hypothetical protein ACRD51_07830 [Candidatus Acidiferrum sp.]